MQWLSLLLVCLLATQSVNAIRYASVPNKQYVQVAIAFEGTTCAQVSNGGNILRNGARDSVKAYFSAKGYSQTIIDSTAGLLDTECVDSSNSKTTFASFRSSVSFQGLNSTDDRDFLWNAFRQGACRGGYDVQTYQVLADAVAAAGLEVAYNKAIRNNPNGARGKIDFVTADNCRVAPASPTPAPASPSPAPATSSPAPESPSPAPSNETSPSPQPASSPAPDNSTSPSPEPSSPSPNPATSPEPTSPAPSPEPASPSPEPASPSPEPASPSPEPASPSPEPASPSPEPASPSPEPASPSPSPSP